MRSPRDLSILHIGAGKYRPFDREHVTYGIWRELASGFRDYHVIARARGAAADWSDGNLRVTLIPSHSDREIEFLFTQFGAVRAGTRARPDVIVCQSPPLGGFAALLIAWRTGARTLIELHGMEFFVPARFGSRLWLLQSLSRFVLHRADLIRVLSPRMGHELARIYGSDLASRSRILPPRVDTARFTRAPRARAANAPLRLAMVATVNANKGQRRLIRTLAEIQFPAELHLVGEGPDLAALYEDADLQASRTSYLRIVVHGPLPHAAVADVLRDCDVFVMYSNSEGTPRTIMEAMAVGLPVVTTNAGFCSDIVEHGVEGIVLGADPDLEIVGELERFMADPALARRMGAAARKRARRDYDAVRLFDEYRHLIAETAQQ